MNSFKIAFAVLCLSVSSFSSAQPTTVTVAKVPSIPSAQVLCVNGGDTSGTHDNTWKKLNVAAGASLTWKRVGECITTPPVPSVPPVPAVPDPASPAAPTTPAVNCAADQWTQKDNCASGPGTFDTTTTISCPAGPTGSPLVVTSSIDNCAHIPAPLPLPEPTPCPASRTVCTPRALNNGQASPGNMYYDFYQVDYVGASCEVKQTSIGGMDGTVGDCSGVRMPTCPAATGPNVEHEWYDYEGSCGWDVTYYVPVGMTQGTPGPAAYCQKLSTQVSIRFSGYDVGCDKTYQPDPVTPICGDMTLVPSQKPTAAQCASPDSLWVIDYEAKCERGISQFSTQDVSVNKYLQWFPTVTRGSICQ